MGILEKNVDKGKLSKWLKGVDLMFGIIGLAVFGAFAAAYLFIRTQLPGVLWTSVYFLVPVAVCYYVALVQFWKVCTQIGRRNAISEECGRAFDIMSVTAMAAAVAFLAKFAWLLFMRSLAPAVGAAIILEVLVACASAVLTGALSKMIYSTLGSR